MPHPSTNPPEHHQPSYTNHLKEATMHTQPTHHLPLRWRERRALSRGRAHYRLPGGVPPNWLRDDWAMDTAERNLRGRILEQPAPVPAALAELLCDNAGQLRGLLMHHVSPDTMNPAPGGCELAWLGCPTHGDHLVLGRIQGWRCELCRFRLRSVFDRIRACTQPAVAVLDRSMGMKWPRPITTTVCAGHLHSETKGAPWLRILPLGTQST